MIRNDNDSGDETVPESTRPLSRREARNVLVLGGFDEAGSVWIPDDPEGANLLVVSYVRDADDYIGRWVQVGGDADAVAVVEARGGEIPGEETDELVRHESPTDLTGIGIQSSEFLTRWRSEDGPTVVFDSLTVLLQYASLETAFQFLHVFTSRVRDAEGLGYYYLDPNAHDEQTVATLKQLFDDAIRT